MSLTERLRKRLEYEDKKERFLLRPFHSNFYHRQFEGYTEYRRPNEKGKMKVIRVYTGQYYRVATGKTQRITRRLGYLALFVVALVCFFRGTMLDVPANRSLVLNLLPAVTLPVLFWMGLGLGNYLFGKELLTIPAYKSGPVRLRRASLTAAILCAIRLASVLMFCLGQQSGFVAGDIQILLCALLCGLCVLFVNRMEAATVYESVENPVRPESDGIEIQ